VALNRKNLCFGFGVSLFFISIFCQAKEEPDWAIYDDDDRIEVTSKDVPQFIKELSGAVAGRIRKDDLYCSGDSCSLYSKNLQEKFGLCDDQPFNQQNAPYDCTGWLINGDTMVTAGHCVDNLETAKNFKWVFNWNDQTPQKFSASQVRSISHVIKVKRDFETGVDYAVVKLNQAYFNPMNKYFEIRHFGEISVYDDISILGHPLGLPMKWAAGAKVSLTKSNELFMATLDSFSGNSGSPVINMVTQKVEGILVRGESDFYYDRENGCRKHSYYLSRDKRGEQVVRIKLIKEIIGLAN